MPFAGYSHYDGFDLAGLGREPYAGAFVAYTFGGYQTLVGQSSHRAGYSSFILAHHFADVALLQTVAAVKRAEDEIFGSCYSRRFLSETFFEAAYQPVIGAAEQASYVWFVICR